jgi:hypothetical protein
MRRGVEGLSYWLGTFYRLLISITSCFMSIGKARVRGSEREGMGDDFVCQKLPFYGAWAILGIGQPP